MRKDLSERVEGKGVVRALVLAAGEGTRLCGVTRPKQFLPLAGRPLLTYCLETYQGLAPVESIALVARRGDEDRCRRIAETYPKVRQIVEGGATRQESVLNGIRAMEECQVVVVQNAVSPFTEPGLIEECIRKASECGAAVGCVKAKQTSAQGNGGWITALHDRTGTYGLCDPQAFGFSRLREVHARAIREGRWEVINDAYLFFAYGAAVALVEGSDENIKVTTRADFLLAEKLVELKAGRPSL